MTKKTRQYRILSQSGSVSNATPSLLVKKVRELRLGGKERFLIVEQSDDPSHYYQCAGGQSAMMLEKRMGGAQYRAYSVRPLSPFPDGTEMRISRNNCFALQRDEWLTADIVCDALLGFLWGIEPSVVSEVELRWRSIEERLARGRD